MIDDGPDGRGAGVGDDDGPVDGHGDDASIRRVDERLGLAICRVGLSGRTLTTYARDHVSVRTPSRSDFRDGNSIDLLDVPGPGELDGWIDRFRDTVGIMGAAHVQVRWEQPLPLDAPPSVPTPDPELVAACEQLDLALSAVTVLLLGDLIDAPPTAPAELVPVGAPSAIPGGATDRRWHAATVLYRYAAGDTPDDWRTVDTSFTDWSVDVQRELAGAGRCQVWVAMRHGGPVGRLSLLHDRQGLAAVEDVIVHPVHRRIGIASSLTHRAVRSHLEADPQARVGIGAHPGSAADMLYRRLGFRPHATVWTALRPGRH